MLRIKGGKARCKQLKDRSKGDDAPIFDAEFQGLSLSAEKAHNRGCKAKKKSG